MSTQENSAALTADDHLILVDGSTFIFRAYHALPPLTRKPDGLPVGAVSGFCNMLWKLLQEGLTPEEGDEPTHFAVIFDHSAKRSGPTSIRNTRRSDRRRRKIWCRNSA
jgi:DNA polymerase-1